MKRLTSFLTAAVIAVAPAVTSPLFSASAELGGFASAGSMYDMGFDFQPGFWSITINMPGTQEQRGYLVLNEDDSGSIIAPEIGNTDRIILSRMGEVANLRYEGDQESYFYDVTEKGDKEYQLKLRDDNLTMTMKLLDPDERENTLVFHTFSELSNLSLQHYKNEHDGYVPDGVHTYIDDDGMAVVQLYEDHDDHHVVVGAYCVDPRNCIGSDLLGNYVDIRTSLAPTAFLRPGIWLAESDGNKYAPTYYYFNENSAEGAMVDQHTGDTVYFVYTLDGNKLSFGEDENGNELVYDIEKVNDSTFIATDADGSKQTFSYIGFNYNNKTRIYNDNEIADMMENLCLSCLGQLPLDVEVLPSDTGFMNVTAYDRQDEKRKAIGHLSVDRYSGKAWADDGSVVQLSDYLDFDKIIRHGVWETYDTLNTEFKAGYLVIEDFSKGIMINGAGGATREFTWDRSGNTCYFKDTETGKEITMYISVIGKDMTLTYTEGSNASVKLRYVGNLKPDKFNFHGYEELSYFLNEYYREKTGYDGTIFDTLDHTDDHMFTVDVIVDDTPYTCTVDKYSGLAMLSDGTVINVLDMKEIQPVIGPSLKTGDINSDGMIDSADASEVLLLYANASTGTGSDDDKAKKAAADVNKDDLVDSNDASLILSYYAYVSTSSGDGAVDFDTFIKDGPKE